MSETTIKGFYERITKVLKHINIKNYEIIFVDDGSPDASLSQAKKLVNKDRRVVVVELSRNFGHHYAIMAGLEQSHGNLVFLIDSDLEEAPEILTDFYNTLSLNQLDVVYGKQQTRRGNLLSRLVGLLYYKSFRLLTNIKQPDNISTCRLMTRDYVSALLLHKEKELSIGGIWLETGFKQQAVDIVKGNTSKSTYTLRKRVKTATDAISSFSNTPLYLNFVSGTLIFIFSLVIAAYFLFWYLIYGIAVSGFTSTIILIALSFGALSLSNGINSIYIAKIFSEVKNRPRYIIRKVHSQKVQEKKQ